MSSKAPAQSESLLANLVNTTSLYTTQRSLLGRSFPICKWDNLTAYITSSWEMAGAHAGKMTQFRLNL